MSALYRRVRSGDLDERRARELLDRATAIKVRLLRDRVSRSVAWKIAAELDWPDVDRAESIALAKLQADRFVTLDPAMAEAAKGYVALASIDELIA